MRTLGPRSVSSLLKGFLDILFALNALFLLFLGVLALWGAVAMAHPNLGQPTWRWFGGPPLIPTSPRGAAGLLLLALYMLGLLGIVGRLRKIFGTMVAGQPFQTENTRRLRVIGLILMAVESSRYAIQLLLTARITGHMFIPPIDYTGLMAIGVIFTLAEILDEGVRMRKDLDLTI